MNFDEYTYIHVRNLHTGIFPQCAEYFLSILGYSLNFKCYLGTNVFLFAWSISADYHAGHIHLHFGSPILHIHRLPPAVAAKKAPGLPAQRGARHSRPSVAAPDRNPMAFHHRAVPNVENSGILQRHAPQIRRHLQGGGFLQRPNYQRGRTQRHRNGAQKHREISHEASNSRSC